jgi:hypothetical protein
MSDYTKATNFTLKDGLTTGDPQKIIKGSELDAEYVAISNAISSKANSDSPTFTGAVNSSQPPTGNSSSRVATTLFVQNALVGAYPVGSIYMNATVATNPGTLLGFGTWVAFGAGKVPVGINSGDSDFDTAEETGGTKDAIIPTHNHTASSESTDSGHTHTYVRSNTTTIASGNALPLNYLYTTGTTNTGYANITTDTTVDNAGESSTGKNLQPYIVVYMWKRTA